MTYKILQLNDNAPSELCFRNYNKDKFNLNNYEVVYEGEVDNTDKSDFTVLEQLYMKFNINHPSDYRGHSISVSDIIELDGTKYYVEDLGYTKL